ALTIEHVMPQSWQRHWPPPNEIEGDESGEARRDRLTHSFGNLTLLTRGLNSKVGNAPYLARRNEITKHTELRLNTYFHDVDHWDEAEILRRGAFMFSKAVEVWQHPGGGSEPDWQGVNFEDETNDSANDQPDYFHAVLAEFAKDLPTDTSLFGKG